MTNVGVPSFGLPPSLPPPQHVVVGHRERLEAPDVEDCGDGVGAVGGAAGDEGGAFAQASHEVEGVVQGVE